MVATGTEKKTIDPRSLINRTSLREGCLQIAHSKLPLVPAAQRDHLENPQLWRCCRLEAMWILIDLSYGEPDTINDLIGEDSGPTGSMYFWTVLRELLIEAVNDLQFFDLVLWLVNNIALTDEDTRALVMHNIHAPRMVLDLLNQKHD